MTERDDTEKILQVTAGHLLTAARMVFDAKSPRARASCWDHLYATVRLAMVEVMGEAIANAPDPKTATLLNSAAWCPPFNAEAGIQHGHQYNPRGPELNGIPTGGDIDPGNSPRWHDSATQQHSTSH